MSKVAIYRMKLEHRVHFGDEEIEVEKFWSVLGYIRKSVEAFVSSLNGKI